VRIDTDFGIGVNCGLNFDWDTAELVVAAPKKQTRKEISKNTAVPPTPQWYPCEADAADAAEARATAGSSNTNDSQGIVYPAT
jgi:hypothetical protein